MDKKFKDSLWETTASGLAGSKDWEVHMQLSPLRQSLLNWYEFSPDSRLLELHAGYGALTGLFCERCKAVTAMVSDEDEENFLRRRFKEQKNLQILRGNLRDLIPEDGEKYDVLVAWGRIACVRDPAETIRCWMQYVKPGGKLLLTAENRYGLKYFCGAKDPYTRIPFDGVNGYVHRKKGKEGREDENQPDASGEDKGSCLSRQELAAAIEKAGISRYQFYYPVPDSRMPQMIFSDGYQKGTNTAERLVDYNYVDPAMLGIEHRIFCEMIDSGALPFMANSFLVELTREGSLSDIIYAVTTTDRGRDWGMATTIRNGGLVKKRALWPEGEKNLEQLHRNTRELADRGIPVVQTKLERDAFGLAVTMPYLEEEGLTTVLKRLALEDRAELIRYFDEIYGYLMASSEMVQEEEQNCGMVLKKAYLDLAPCNCFYVKDKGRLVFYDQEFVMENCPVQFAMYRTLTYCYASARILEQSIPLQTMYARYGIDGPKITAFAAREEAFIRQVRNMEEYRQIFRWATPDEQKIYQKMNKMAEIAEEESREKTAKPYAVGYVPGVFDLFHTGHLNLLERCKSRCEHLIVGVLTDELVEFYKGKKPVIPYEDRARIIGALKAVDQVIPVDFSNTDKLDAWNQLHYDCHFSGDDHVGHWKEVWEELKKRGSTMEFFPYTQGISSSQIREKLTGK